MENELDRLLKGKSEWDEGEDLRSKSSRWEVTPRTATQSKRLKWDQTPLGYIKIEDDSWDGNKIREVNTGWDQGEKNDRVAILYSEMSLREINMCLPSKGYRRHDLIQSEDDLNRISDSDLPEIREDERDFFMPIFNSRDEVEAKIYRNLLLVKSGDRKMSKHGKKMLLRTGLDVDTVLEKTILMVMSLELEVGEKLKIIDVMQHILESVDVEEIRYVREVLFVLSSYAYFYPLRRPAVTALSLIHKKGLEFVVEKIERDFSSREAHIREMVGKTVATCVSYFGTKKMDVLFKRLVCDPRNEAKKAFMKSVVYTCNLVGRAVVSGVAMMLDLLRRLLLDRNRFVRIDAANTISAMFSLMKPPRTTQTNEVFTVLMDGITRSQSIEFHPFLAAMSYLCIGDSSLSETTFTILMSSENRGISELKVFERICNYVDSNKTRDYFISAIEAIFSFTETHRGLVMNICIEMVRDKKTASVVLKQYENSSNVSVVSEIFSKVLTLDFEKEDVERYYANIRSAIGHDDTTVGVVDLLVDRKFLEPRFISYILEDSMKFIRNSHAEVRIRGLRVISKIARMLDVRDLVYCGSILFENMNGADQTTLTFVLMAIHSVYNSHRFKHASELVPNILPILRSKENKVVEAGIVLLHAICMNSPDECEKINRREWLRISYELVDSLSFCSRRMRKMVVGSLGYISRIVGPQEILNILMDILESEDKQQRTGASLAISALGEHNELFSILPTLLTDYSIPNALTQQGILRAMIHVFQRTSPVSTNYIYSVLPMVEDAIMDEDPGYRSLGLTLIKHIVLGYRTPRIDTELILHMLNLVWMNILDFTPFIRSSFDECMEAFVTVLSSQVMYRYVLQGLFHPAKAVRERYQDVFEIMKHYDSTTLSQCFLVEDLLWQ